MKNTDLVSSGKNYRLDGMFGVGIAFCALGMLAMIVPVFATMAMVSLLAIAMVFWGSLGAMMSYGSLFPDTKIVTVAFALVAVIGIVFLIFPYLGAEFLTLLVVASLLMEGIYSILLSLALREANTGWFWMFGPGVIALVVALLILLGWPSTATWVLGLGLGVNFVTTGAALILLGQRRGA